MKDIINCSKAEKLIPKYIKGETTDIETTWLLDHIDNCDTCREELTIQYFISEGLDNVEELNDYNLLKGFDRKIKTSRSDIKIRKNARDGFIACIVGVVVVLCLGALTVVL